MSRWAERSTEGHLGQAGKDLECQVEKQDSMLRRWGALETLEGEKRELRGAHLWVRQPCR